MVSKDVALQPVKGAEPITEGSSRLQSLVTDPNYGIGTTEYMRSRGGYAIVETHIEDIRNAWNHHFGG